VAYVGDCLKICPWVASRVGMRETNTERDNSDPELSAGCSQLGDERRSVPEEQARLVLAEVVPGACPPSL